MELDNLKTIWKEQDTLPEREPDPTELLMRLVSQRSRGPIARMRSNLRRESLLMIITYIPCIIAYLLVLGGKLWGISVLFLLILIFFGVYYFKKNQLLRKM